MLRELYQRRRIRVVSLEGVDRRNRTVKNQLLDDEGQIDSHLEPAP